MFLLWDLWLTTTNLSYRFPILKLPPPPCAVLLVIYNKESILPVLGVILNPERLQTFAKALDSRFKISRTLFDNLESWIQDSRLFRAILTPNLVSWIFNPGFKIWIQDCRKESRVRALLGTLGARHSWSRSAVRQSSLTINSNCWTTVRLCSDPVRSLTRLWL